MWSSGADRCQPSAMARAACSAVRVPVKQSGAMRTRTRPVLHCGAIGEGEHYGPHVDAAIRLVGERKLRTDVSATLFFSAPEEYDGGELVISDTYGEHEVKLPAGDLIVYPASSLHQVQPVTRGARIASFFWVQSMVRDDAKRRLLFDMDRAIQTLIHTDADNAAVLSLTSVYHNLLRRWAET